jgi:hypothetical protein
MSSEPGDREVESPLHGQEVWDSLPSAQMLILKPDVYVHNVSAASADIRHRFQFYSEGKPLEMNHLVFEGTSLKASHVGLTI